MHLTSELFDILCNTIFLPFDANDEVTFSRRKPPLISLLISVYGPSFT